MSQTQTGFEKFAEILERKIRQQIEAEVLRSNPEPKNGPAPSQSMGSNDLLASLLTSVDPVHFYAHTAIKRYPHKVVRPKPRPAHSLNAKQAHCFQFFLKQGGQLLENFTKRELEAAFRSLALKLHPDQGGSAEKFRLLLEARLTLQELL